MVQLTRLWSAKLETKPLVSAWACASTYRSLGAPFSWNPTLVSIGLSPRRSCAPAAHKRSAGLVEKAVSASGPVAREW